MLKRTGSQLDAGRNVSQKHWDAAKQQMATSWRPFKDSNGSWWVQRTTASGVVENVPCKDGKAALENALNFNRLNREVQK